MPPIDLHPNEPQVGFEGEEGPDGEGSNGIKERDQCAEGGLVEHPVVTLVKVHSRSLWLEMLKLDAKYGTSDHVQSGSREGGQ
jgi:hypothetical protein